MKILPLHLKAAATSVALSVAGDALVQRISRKRFDAFRSQRTAEYSLLTIAPQLMYFEYLGKLVPGTAFNDTLAKFTMNQVAFGPTTICLAMVYHLARQGLPEKILPKISTDLPITFALGWLYWFPATIAVYSVKTAPAAHMVILTAAGIPWKLIFAHFVNK